MPAETMMVYTLSPDTRDALEHRLADLGMELGEAPYVLVRGKGPDGSVTFYTSGKLVIRGKGAERIAAALAGILPSTRTPIGPGALEKAARIGTDESGKGDYFGPLVVAAVYADAGIEGRLLEMGVKDSKRLADSVILKLDGQIRELAPHAVVPIGPAKYNELYEKIGNLNRLLAWGHARAIENLLAKVGCDRALTDQFGDERFVRNALMQRGKQITLEQRPKAESDAAVAAASILARAEFVRRLEKLSEPIGEKLPKGAGPAVDEVARRIFARKGLAGLRGVAKLHFVTTAKIASP